MRANAISVGLPISLSGRYALQGRQCRAGMECYARWVNETGGIFLKNAGRPLPVQLKIYDDESDAVTARTQAERLIQEDRVDLLFGPYGSSLTLVAAAAAERHRKVLWNHSGATDALGVGPTSWTVSVLTPASLYLCSLLDLIRRRKPKMRRVTLLHATTGFATAVADGARAWAERENLALTVQPYQSDQDDFTALLRGMAFDPPDVLLGVGRFEDDVRLAEHLCAVRPRVKAVGLVAAGISQFREQLQERAEGFFAPVQWASQTRYAVDYGPPTGQFLQQYLDIAPGPVDYPAAQAFAAGLVAQKCVETAGTLDQRALRAAAARCQLTTFYGPFAIDRSTGRQIAHTMIVVQWQGGRQVIVWPEAVAEADPMYPGPFWF